MKREKLSFIVLFACLFIFILFAFLFSSLLGGVIKSSRCVDSDGGINEYVKGNVSLCVNEECTAEAVDICDADYVTEYYCTNFGDAASKVSKCTWGCYEGECLHIGEKEKIEQERAEDLKTEEPEEITEEIEEIICDEAWQCEGNTRGLRQVDCTWIKEEYCKYGCEEGECIMPGWWNRFVFWLREMFS